MEKFWKGTAITLFVLIIAVFSILSINISEVRDVRNELKIVKSNKKEIEKQNDSLKNQLNEYGQKVDLLFLCIGYESDSVEYPTIKIYTKDEREIGKFYYIFNNKSQKINLGDKFFLTSTPKKNNF